MKAVPSRIKAAAISAGLSLLFVIVYSFAHWVTSLRSSVPSFFFSWERGIPFVSALIMPYLSLDLFFIAAPFLARTNRELAVFTRRIAAAILIAGICFLLFPLKFAFDRPDVPGAIGQFFSSFRSLDLPFNEFPCLHIALLLLLADTYFRHTRGIVRILLAAWFLLIAISPIFVYQHHLIDLLGGTFLAALCIHFFREEPILQPFTPNRRVALYYALGIFALTALAFMWPPVTLLLLWPAISLGIISAAYLFIGPGIYRKQNGKLPFTAWFLLWPVLIGQRLSLLYYARQCRPFDQLTPNLIIGRRLSDAEARLAMAHGVTAVIDLTGEFNESASFRMLPYLQLPILDLTGPTQTQLQQALAFLRLHAGGMTYVHCKIGYSRTAVIAAAALLAANPSLSMGDALAKLRARPSIVIRPEALQTLHEFFRQMNHAEPPVT